jgi:glucose-6-phosphate isomerase
MALAKTIQSSNFLSCSAVKKLKQLAQNPLDLSKPHVLTPERISRFYAEGCGFKLLYGTEKVTDEVMQALQELADETQALAKMQRMQNGEVINYIENYPSENRAVLHTATRDFFEDPNPSQAARQAAQEARQEVEKLRSFMAKVDTEKKFTEMIMVAMGGSDLGPRANYFALEYLHKPERKVHFISNVDPDDVLRALQQADLKRSLVLVVSKSGTTLETFANEEFVREYFRGHGLNPKEHFIAVTCPGTPMDDPNKYLEIFHMWEWIGGRFSTSSMSGAVLLAFAFGFDVYWEFLQGAHAMDRLALNPSLHQNLPLLAALLGIWNRNFLHYPTFALIPYSQALFRYPAHLQQVAMESNGKRIDQQGNSVAFETGPVVWGEPGTSAQHSFFQLIHQGTDLIPVQMIGFVENQRGKDVKVEGTTSQEKLLANLFAQALSLATGQASDNPNKFFPGNRPAHILLAQKLTPFIAGALLAFYEHMIAFQGFIWGINSFDQEGVQLGKVLANQILTRFSKKESKSYPLGDAFLQHLDTLRK